MGKLLVNLELMKAGCPPIDIKFTDKAAYYNAFDEYHTNNNLGVEGKGDLIGNIGETVFSQSENYL